MYDIANVESAEYYDEMNTVVQEYLKGTTDPTKLSKQLSIPRRKVLDYIDAWKAIAQNHDGIKERANEALTALTRHFDMIISELWAVVNDPAVTLTVKASTLKTIADVDGKRQEALQKAGLYDDSALGDQLAKAEEKADAIRVLLTEVANKHPAAKGMIMEGLEKIFKKVGRMPAEEEPIKGEVVV